MTLTRHVSVAEQREMAEKAFKVNPDDNVLWLEYERDMAAALREEFFAEHNHLKANEADARALRFFKAASELKDLRERLKIGDAMLARRCQEGR